MQAPISSTDEGGVSMNCEYCTKNSLRHINWNEYLPRLAAATPDERVKLIPEIFAELDAKTGHHTTHARQTIKDYYCSKCGCEKEQFSDDDRYIYICTECYDD